MKVTVGIDPGKKTGLAVMVDGQFRQIETMLIHNAMARVKDLFVEVNKKATFKVYFEDARKRGGNSIADRHKLQGVGGVKRDCTIWEDYLTDLGVDYGYVIPTPGGYTKIDAKTFERLTGWQGKTSNHGRDAAMMILGR